MPTMTADPCEYCVRVPTLKEFQCQQCGKWLDIWEHHHRLLTGMPFTAAVIPDHTCQMLVVR